MSDVIGIFPFLIPIAAFGMVVLLRRMEHQEKLKMIEKGIDVSQFKSHKRGGSGAIRFALMAIGVGVGLLIGNMLDAYTSLNDQVCYFSMVFLFGGIGLFIAHKINDKREKEELNS
ncbi:MAG: hypothetical protein KDD41_11165 [Flavobacteriales bacterium]|nr:hypothetical protein [Flavobacteriales bacterium]